VHPPVSGGKVTSIWGIRFLAGKAFHTGTDYGLPTGSPVRSIGRGTVKESSFNERHGNYIIIGHLPHIDSRYLHLDTLNVKKGEKVNSHTVIGAVGNTGISTGEHLHFEIRLFNMPLPPLLFLIPGRIFQAVGGYRLVDSIVNKAESLAAD
jgi:murein DD-endopeptidase MepM/ murein hydrolase activator NlpD